MENSKQTNIACRVFKEQFKLIDQLAEQERPIVLYLAMKRGLNQIENQFEYQNDNQIENQNENAYVSVSDSESSYLNHISDIGKCILELLSKNIIWKEFSNNYGGKRVKSGRKTKVEQKNNNGITNDKQKDSNSITKESETEKESYDTIEQTSTYNFLKAFGTVGSAYKDEVYIDNDFNLFQLDHPQTKQMIELYGDGLAYDIQKWIRRKFNGKRIGKRFIIEQFAKFYERNKK